VGNLRLSAGACMLGSPSNEYERGSHGSAQVSDCYGIVHWPSEASGPETGISVLDAIDHEGVTNYQPYWAVRAHLLQRLGKTREASDAYDRAIGLAEDPAVRQFLLQKRS